MSNYLTGSDVLGADFFDTSGVPEQFIVTRLKSVPDIIAKQGGAAGSTAYKLAPQTITNTVFNTIRDKFAQGLKDEGVDAEVTVVAAAPVGGAQPPGEFVNGMAVAGAFAGIALLIKTMFFGGRR